jgi:hypothetical protein
VHLENMAYLTHKDTAFIIFLKRKYSLGLSLGATYKREKVMYCYKPQLFTMSSFVQTTVRYQKADRKVL